MEAPVRASIIITCYNYEKYIARAIESAMNQDYPKGSFEVIVVNDGSTDGSREAIDTYAGGVRALHIANGGLEAAANTGIRASVGEYILRLDADDTLEPFCLKHLVPLLDFNSDIHFAYGDYYMVTDGKRERKRLPVFDREEILSRGDFLATGTLYRKSSMEAVGLYSEKQRNCGLENCELVLKMLAMGFEGYHLRLPFFDYIYHDSNMSFTRREKIIEYGIDMYKRLGLGSYRTNENHPYGLKL